MKGKPNKAVREITLAQHELVVIAAFLAGAARKRVDTEDIAIKAHQIAPGRFSWRKYKDQIDLEIVYKRLWELTDTGSNYITGSRNDGWMLTLAGTTFAEGMVDKLKDLTPARARIPKKEENWMKRERARMSGEMALSKFRSGRESEVTVGEAERFFRLDDYVIGDPRERKIRQAENAFHDDPGIGPFISKIAAIARNKK